MPSPVFLLKCLGYPELRGPDGKAVRIRVKKHLALLVYLATERRRYHDRERLVGLLWPTVSPTKGRHSIATAISLLRTIFGRAAFPTNRTAIRFTATNLELDLDRLEAGRVLGGEGGADLDVDGFLQGFDIHDAPEFGLWKEREHARRLPAIHAGLLTLIDHGRRRGSHDEIMQRAERLLALDHLAEEGIRAKMEALALAGDRFSALRVFDEWREQLAAELGAEPSMLVEGMAGQLRKRGWEPKEPNPVPAVPAEQWRDRRFVGRKAEYRSLYETWEAVHQYRPQHIMIAGDSGVGKTTLAQRLVTAAGLEGASVSRVQCYQMEQRIPFGMIGALVAGLLGRPGVTATSPEALAEVARIVPQVKDHFRVLPQPKQSEGESARLLFAEGVMDLLGAVMGERPLLLVVDDLHHADEASMAVLHLVMRRIVEGRFMVVLLTELDRARFQWRNFQPIDSAPSVSQMDLDPMSDAETRELIESILDDGGARPTLPVIRALCRSSRGFPLVLELVVTDWRRHGTDSVALTFRLMTAHIRLLPTDPQDCCAALVERALAGVSERAIRVLGLASLLGARLEGPGWYALIDLSIGETHDGLAELTRTRLLRDSGAGLDFLNDVIRGHVYQRIPAAIRKALHSAIADTLLTSQRVGTNAGLELAWHLTRAGRELEALPHLVRGANEAGRLGAPDEAILALESAVPTLQPHDADRCRILAAGHYQELGRWQDSLNAIAYVDSADASHAADRRALEVWARWNLGEVNAEAADRHLTELLDIARNGFALSAETVLMAARIACSGRSRDAMTRVLATAREIECQSVADMLPLFVALGSLSFHLGRRAESVRYAQLGSQVLAAKRADSPAARLAMGIGALHAVAGDYVKADAALRAALVIAERLENDSLIGQVLTNCSLTALRRAKYADAIRLAERAIERLASQSVDSYILRCFEVGSLGHALSGRPADATDWIRRGDRAAATVGVPWARNEWSLGKSDVLWALGRRRQALATAVEPVELSWLGPVDLHQIGQLSRWSVRLSIDRKSPLGALDWVGSAVGDGQLDAIDEVELAAASIELETAAYGLASIDASQRYRAARQRLSPEVWEHIVDLQLFVDSNPATRNSPPV